MRLFLAAVAAICVSGSIFPAWSQAPVGVVERLRGNAARTQGADTEVLATGAAIFAGDVLKTGDDARLSIRLIDESHLTLSENAEFSVEAMAYRADASASEAGQQSLKYLAGVFRFTSGRLGKTAPDQFALATPVATIGIRGTEFLGGELTVGMPAGTSHYGFQIVTGAIEIAAPLGSVILDEPGEGTFLPIAGGAAPTPVRQWTPAEAAEAEAAVAF